jgi:hypothetical protein
MATLTLQPLSEGETRLVRLNLDQERADLAAELQTVALSDDVEYIAVSYTW